MEKGTTRVVLVIDFPATSNVEQAREELTRMADKWVGPTGTRIIEVVEKS